MENSKSGESDASSGEEPNPKRCRRDPSAVHAKSVMVLLDSDVYGSENNRNLVRMPNTIEMARLKKPEKGQYGKINFTSEMTQMDVLTALHSQFPILRTKKRLGCASAADNRTRLDFHGDKRIWNGTLINRNTRGNSALYVFAEGNHESEESQVVLVPEGPVLSASQRLQQMSQMSSTVPEMLQKGRVDLTTQAHHTTGGILQQGHLSVVQKTQSDPVLQTITNPVAQASLNPVSMASGSQQGVLIAQISEQGSSLQQVTPAAAAPSPPAPAPAAAAYNNDPVGAFFPQTTSTEKLSVIRRKRKRHPTAYQEFPLLVSLSEGETTDSGIDSLLDSVSNHDTDQLRDIVRDISPWKGSTKGGDKFYILVYGVASFDIDYVACFQNCGTVHLEQLNAFTLTGVTPKSRQGPGPVIVTLSSFDGSWWGGNVVFEYIDDPLTDEEYLSKVVTDEDMRRKLFDRMHNEMSSYKPSDGQTSDSFAKTGPESSSLNQSKCAWSVELLRLLVYKAAEIGGRQFIRVIFSTSAGKVVFNSYKNNATLPEDVARTNGHLALADYLQDVDSRLSKESNSDSGTESIDWLELKHAVDEEQSLTSGSDAAQILEKCQPPGYPESDDDESDYFADDEISLCSSPCRNNASDSENEDHSQISKNVESRREEEVIEKDNLPVEDIDSSELPLHQGGNQLEVIPSMKAENAVYEHKELDSDDVESHSSGDDITEKEDESTVLCRGEVENWDTLGSEVISAIEEASTGTLSSCTATPNVGITNGIESCPNTVPKALRMIDTRRAISDEIRRCKHFLLYDVYTKLKGVNRKKPNVPATDDTVNLSGIFKPLEERSQPRPVLIQGNPGAGKSTYCQILAFVWATGRQSEDCIERFDTMPMLRCCDMKSDLRETIYDQLLSQEVRRRKLRDTLADFVCPIYNRLLLVHDGLDEVPSDKLPTLLETVQGGVLPEYSLLATARHKPGMEEATKHFDTPQEIREFTDEDAKQIICRFVTGDWAKKPLSNLRGDENLKNISPENKTELYMEIIRCVQKGLPEMSEDLIQEVNKTPLKHLGKITLNGLRKDSLDFEQSEIGSFTDQFFASFQPEGSEQRWHVWHEIFPQNWLAACYRFELLEETAALIKSITTQVNMKTTEAQPSDASCKLHVSMQKPPNKDDQDAIGLVLVAREFGSSLELHSLSLQDQKLSVANVHVLSNSLKWNTTVTELNLFGNNIGDAGASGLADLLKSNKILTKLKLSQNAIGEAGALQLAAGLKQGNTPLTVLDLADNNIGDVGATCLADGLTTNKTLREFNLSHNSIGDVGATCLSDALKVNTILTLFNLSHNNIGDGGATYFSVALTINTTLTLFSLSHNDIGDAGATCLADALTTNKTLAEFSLSHNSIGDVGATCLADWLTTNKTLTEFNLSHNSIGDVGASCLSEALKVNTTLTLFNLSHNKIGDGGATSLADALTVNRFMSQLNLFGNNDVGESALEPLSNLVPAGRVILPSRN